MAKYSIEEQTLDNIANAILAKTGSSTALTPEQMPTAIAGIETGGSVTPPYMECSIDGTNNITSVNMHGYSVIPRYSFYYQEKLVNVDFSASNITHIGYAAFSNCSLLQLDSLPESITSIDQTAFQRCVAITLSALPESITEINDNVFYGCSQITLTTIPDQITVIGKFGFGGCSSITWTRLPNALTEIGQYAFQNCYGLSITKIPDTIATIPKYAFNSCTGLINLEIGASTILQCAFQKCTGLQKVWIRNTCSTITTTLASQAPFADCSSELIIYVEASEAPSGWSSYFSRTGTTGNSTATVVYNQTTCPW